MLIWLDSSVLTADLASDIDACHGVSSIFDAVFRGEHYAIGTRETLNALAKNPHLAAGTRRVISAVHSNFSTIGGIADAVSTRLVVTHNKSAAPVKGDDGGLEVPLRYVGVNCVKKTVLLAENLDDACAFEHAAKHYQAWSQIRGRVCLEKAHGGGSTTPDVLSNLAGREKRWCLCITDSDRLCPSDEMDLTARRCRDISKLDTYVASHHDLGVREIENAVPLALVAEAIPATHKELWDWHVGRLFALRPDAHRYCDIKFGTTRRYIYSQATGSPRRVFWDSVLSTLSTAAALKVTCHEETCPNPADKKCDCHVTYGFGENLLTTLLKYLDSNSAHDSEKRTRNDPLRDQWIAIGKCVYEWACAPSPMRS